MSDYRAVVERLAGGAVMPEPAFDRLVRRRERRRRSRQIVAGSLALVVAAVATVAVARAFHAVQPPRPAGPSITAKNVSRLELAWSAEGPTSTPVISEGRVFATSSDRVFAYPLDCASEGESCDPSWTGDIGPAHTGIQSALAVSDGVVYVTSDTVYAFSTDCRTDGGTCPPLWKGDVSGPDGLSSPVVSQGVVLAVGDHTLYAFGARCGSGGSTCRPLWTMPHVGHMSPCCPSAPVVADGLVFATGGHSRELLALPVRCSTDGNVCRDPAWTWTSTEDLGDPVVQDGVVYLGDSHGRMSAFPALCSTGGPNCRPTWSVDTGDGYGPTPIVSGGVAYTSALVIGPHPYRLDAYSTSCVTGAGSCPLLWQAFVPRVTSVAAGGDLAYVGGANGRLLAFPRMCGSYGATCRPLWKTQLPSEWTYVFVHDGVVFARSMASRKLYAFPAVCADGGGLCSPLWKGSVGSYADVDIAVSGTSVAATGSDRLSVFRVPAQRGPR
jgi:hypothetical protein